MNAFAQIETTFAAVFYIQKLDDDWYVASSKDLPNIMVDGSSIDDICKRIPLITERLFKAKNQPVEVVDVEKTTLSDGLDVVASLLMDYKFLD